jgi:glycosyltransferase involved in cell wall biosynthesis
MGSGVSAGSRVTVDGKFFRLGTAKFYVKGVAYGPFARNSHGEPFPETDRVADDFALIQNLGANVIRVYHPPPAWLLDLAGQHGLRLLIDLPWTKHWCFLDTAEAREKMRAGVRKAVHLFRGHPAAFACSLVNEIPADIVRWSGHDAMSSFIDELVHVAKEVDPDCLYTMGNYPPTEFLRPQNLDFVCYNVYLHDRKAFVDYLARLQIVADAKPLVLGEIGVDSLREGEESQGDILSWKIETSFRSGLAGAIVFSFTDDWVKHETPVLDWAMGLTTRDRQPKKAFNLVKAAFAAAPYFPLHRVPRVSVIVACYNGARTLKACLDSLVRLNYPDYEVILVDDGSTDATPEIAAQHPNVRYLRQPNLGLSEARQTGIKTAQGEIVAFTDADCRADEDWLYYLVGDLVSSDFVGIGGPNYLPPDDSWVAAAVMVSPGGPAHVMLTDRVAEHIPGCNMAFYKWALAEIGGFDRVFRHAGDDVDVCWRLQERRYQIGFSPAAFVWHYRRSTVRDYLKQQAGYGRAEALLERKHPEYFNSIGGSLWQGRIYSPAKPGLLLRSPMIYRGLFGTGSFQSLYLPRPVGLATFFTSLEYYVLVVLPLLVLAGIIDEIKPVAITSLLLSAAVCIVAAVQADIRKRQERFWSRPLVALLFLLQPIVRGGARYHARIRLSTTPGEATRRLDFLTLKYKGHTLDEVRYWSEHWIDRAAFVSRVLEELDKQGWPNRGDVGWNNFDVEVFGNRWSRLQVTTVTELHEPGKVMLRCRLRTFWSLPAKILFWGTSTLELIVLGFVGGSKPWLWLILASLPLVALTIRQQARNLQRLIAVFLDELATELKLTKTGACEATPVKSTAVDQRPEASCLGAR